MFPILDKRQEPEWDNSVPQQESKDKQKGWDDRFTVAKGIPEYSPLKDKHVRSYRKTALQKRYDHPDEVSLMKNNDNTGRRDKMTWSRKKYDVINERLQTQHVQQNFGLCRDNVKINMMIRDLEKVWVSERIPDFYSYYFMGQLKNIDVERLQDLLVRQIRMIRNKESHFFDINKSIQARETCLIEMRKTLESLKILKRSRDEEGFQKKLVTLQQEISHLRKLTLFIIDKIKKWRDWLISLSGASPYAPSLSQQNTHENFVFLYADQNYLMRILNDTNFLSNTILSDELNMATKNDPFILRPFKQERTAKNHKFMQLIDCDTDLKVKMTRALEYLAAQKAEQFRTKINAPQPKHMVTEKSSENAQKIYKVRAQQMLKEKKMRMKTDGNYETDIERIQQFKQLEKQRQKLDRQEKNQVRINAIKSIYEGKQRPKDYKDSDNKEGTQTDNEIVFFNNKHAFGNPADAHNQSMPKLINKPDNRTHKAKSYAAQSKKKLPKGNVREEESQFESMLRRKQIQLLREVKVPQSKKLKDRFTTKRLMQDKDSIRQLQKIVGSYNQKKLVNNVRGKDGEIRSKIQQIKEQQDSIMSEPPARRLPLKQSELIQELKGQIIAKLQREAHDKERLKRAQREQETKMLEDMKAKLRLEFEERITEEKSKRQIERLELERQLQAEDEKLIEQKRMEVELIVKMNHEKYMREIQKIKSTNLSKQKQLKKKLKEEREKRLDFEKKAKKQKLMAIQKTLKNTLQIGLTGQMSQKVKRQTEEQVRIQADRIYGQHIRQIQKELQILKVNEAMQIEKTKRENQIQYKMLTDKYNEQVGLKADLKQLMRERMDVQKKQHQQFMLYKRKERERQIKQVNQSQIMYEMNAQQRFIQQNRQRKRVIEDQVYRDKMREKLQRQMRIDVIKKTTEELQQREVKKKMITEQLQRAQAKLDEQMMSGPIDKAKIESEVRKDIIERAIIDKKLEKQHAKNELRDQFEKELLSSGIAENYTQKQDFLIKDITVYKDSAFLQGKLDEQRMSTPIPSSTGFKHTSDAKDFAMRSGLTGMSPIKPQSPTIHQQLRMATQKSEILEKEKTFHRLNDSQLTNERTRLGMTQDQYQIYKKKKRVVDVLRDDNEGDRRNVRPIEQLEQQQVNYQRVVIRGQSQDKYFGLSRNDQKKRDTASKQRQPKKKKQKKQKRKKSSSENDQDKRDKKGMQRQATDSQPDVMLTQSDGSQQGWKQTKVKKTIKDKSKDDRGDSKEITKNKKKHKGKQESSEQKKPKEQLYKRKSTKKSKNASPVRKQSSINQNMSRRSFETSDSEVPQKKRKKGKKSQSEDAQPQSQEEEKVIDNPNKAYQQVQLHKRQTQNLHINSRTQRRSQSIPIVNPTAGIQRSGDKFNIRVEAVQEGELDEYVGSHFLKLPREQLNIQIQTRQQLYRKLMNEVTFSILVGFEDKKLQGICVAYHDRNKQQSRRFVITHIGTYKNESLFDFCIAMCNYIFKKDPCDEVQMSFRFDQSQQIQLEMSNDFNNKFDRYGAIFQKKIEDEMYQRKYVMKRPFNLKCEIHIGAQSKHSFVNLFSISSTLLVSNAELIHIKEEDILSKSTTPQREMSYSIMVSEVFRNCLSPEEAETLKNKVKEYLKLKELLVLIVMLEKKKIKLDELKMSEYSTMTELNMRLMSQGKQLIRMIRDGAPHNRIFHCELNQAFKLPFNFQTTTLPLEDSRAVHQTNYFRMAAIAPHKLYTIKSSLYNTQMHVIPTENAKFKLFLMSAAEYNQIKEPSNLDLFMYIRLFLKNVKSHNVANWKYVWVPEMATKGHWAIRQYRSFLEKDIYAFDNININYHQFIPGSLIIQPEHKDLVITPPFIIGILSVTLEQVSEGSPLYVRLLDSDSLKIVESQSK